MSEKIRAIGGIGAIRVIGVDWSGLERIGGVGRIGGCQSDRGRRPFAVVLDSLGKRHCILMLSI